MIYLIKNEEYFHQLRSEHKEAFLHISSVDKSNLSLYELNSLFENQLYTYYFFEYTPYLDFFANYHFQEDINIYILIANSCYIPLILRMKSHIIMENVLDSKEELIQLRSKVLNILKQNGSHPLFKSMVKDFQFVFFNMDNKSAGDLLSMLVEKYDCNIER